MTNDTATTQDSKGERIRAWLATQDGPRTTGQIMTGCGFTEKEKVIAYGVIGWMRSNGLLVQNKQKWPYTYALGRPAMTREEVMQKFFEGRDRLLQTERSPLRISNAERSAAAALRREQRQSAREAARVESRLERERRRTERAARAAEEAQRRRERDKREREAARAVERASSRPESQKPQLGVTEAVQPAVDKGALPSVEEWLRDPRNQVQKLQPWESSQPLKKDREMTRLFRKGKAA